eukprot:3158042-Amphidinium_carterae.1
MHVLHQFNHIRLRHDPIGVGHTGSLGDQEAMSLPQPTYIHWGFCLQGADPQHCRHWRFSPDLHSFHNGGKSLLYIL